MAGSQADVVSFGCRILCDAHLPGPASHDGAGRRFVLLRPAEARFVYALDVELRDLPAPEFLSAALGPLAMKIWGEVEVTAKLLEVPAHLMLRRFLSEGSAKVLEAESIELSRADDASHWRVVGRRAAVRD